MILCCNPTFNNPVKIPLPLLWYCIEYAKKYTFFVSFSHEGDRYRSTKAAISVTPSGTLLTFSCPLCLILSYHISTAAVHVVPYICFCPYPPTPSSSRISFVVPLVLPLCHIFLLMSQFTWVSTITSSEILIHHTCNLVCLLMLYLPTWFYPDFFIFHHIHHYVSMSPPYLLSCIYYEYLLLLSPPYHISDASASIILSLCSFRLHNNTSILML